MYFVVSDNVDFCVTVTFDDNLFCFVNQVILCTVNDNVDGCVTNTFDDNLICFLNHVVLCTVNDNVDLCVKITFDDNLFVFESKLYFVQSVTMWIAVLQSRLTTIILFVFLN